jgi:hypothetical protein
MAHKKVTFSPFRSSVIEAGMRVWVSFREWEDMDIEVPELCVREEEVGAIASQMYQKKKRWNILAVSNQ